MQNCAKTLKLLVKRKYFQTCFISHFVRQMMSKYVQSWLIDLISGTSENFLTVILPTQISFYVFDSKKISQSFYNCSSIWLDGNQKMYSRIPNKRTLRLFFFQKFSQPIRPILYVY